MNNCYTGTEVPTPTVEPCGGIYTSTSCIATPNSITYLSLAEGATQTEVNASLVAALQAKDQQLAELPYISEVSVAGPYADDAAADADVALPVGYLYTLEGSRIVYRKP
jgi:hypothetical protein